MNLDLPHLLQMSVTSGSADECWASFMSLLRPIGLDAGMLVYAPGGQARKDRFLFHSDYPAEFTADYIAAGGPSHDLTVQLALSELFRKRRFSINNVPIIEWRKIEAMIADDPSLLTPESLVIEELSREHNVELGFSCMLWNPNQHEDLSIVSGGVGLAATGMSEAEFDAAVMPLAPQIAHAMQILDFSLRRFSASDISEMCDLSFLTERERDILCWLGEGLSLREIADTRLNRSVSLLHKDIRKLKDKLAADTPEELATVGMLIGVLK
jgi:DNA-binding CsgD family transcriptional regulator